MLVMRQGESCERARFGWIGKTGEPAPFEQIVIIGEFVAEYGAGGEASSNGVDKIQAEPAANKLKALVCFNLSHSYGIATTIVSLTGYQARDIL